MLHQQACPHESVWLPLQSVAIGAAAELVVVLRRQSYLSICTARRRETGTCNSHQDGCTYLAVVEGVVDGVVDGVVEGVVDGVVEGVVDGVVEGVVLV